MEQNTTTEVASKSRLHQRQGSRRIPTAFGNNALLNTTIPESTPIKDVQQAPKPGPVTWMSLPRKRQLAILFASRLFDFLQVASLQAYIFHQLKSFDTSLPDSAISAQAGILQGCYTAAQIATAILWGKVADASWGGRKMVLLIGLAGTAVSCIGYGFATTFSQAAFFRVLGGGLNGTVGIIRTMIAEITKEKKYQSRAFLILPISFNVAALLGPVLGGLLSEPTTAYPELFGGITWLEKYPFALPNLLGALFLTVTLAAVFFGLEETLSSRKDRFDMGLHLAQKFTDIIKGRRSLSSGEYAMLATSEHSSESELKNYEEQGRAATPTKLAPESARKLPFSRLWTWNVIFTLTTCAVFDFHMGAFNNLWTLLLSTPRDLTDSSSLPFLFTGGLGMQSAAVGFATAIIGIIGMLLQLFLYPAVHSRLGTLRSFRWFLLFFPVAYAVAPYLAVLPSTTAPPEPSSGIIVWFGIVIVLLLQVMARTFALPATIILLNNCSPHPSVLGTIHGLGMSVSSAFRTIGPIISGWWYGWGLEIGVVGLSWWATAAVAAGGCVTATWVYEGSGHEIFLPGEEPDMHDEHIPMTINVGAASSAVAPGQESGVVAVWPEDESSSSHSPSPLPSHSWSKEVEAKLPL